MEGGPFFLLGGGRGFRERGGIWERRGASSVYFGWGKKTTREEREKRSRWQPQYHRLSAQSRRKWRGERQKEKYSDRVLLRINSAERRGGGRFAPTGEKKREKEKSVPDFPFYAFLIKPERGGKGNEGRGIGGGGEVVIFS